MVLKRIQSQLRWQVSRIEQRYTEEHTFQQWAFTLHLFNTYKWSGHTHMDCIAVTRTITFDVIL